MTSNLYRHDLQVEALLCTARDEHAAALRASAPPILHAALTSISARACHFSAQKNTQQQHHSSGSTTQVGHHAAAPRVLGVWGLKFGFWGLGCRVSAEQRPAAAAQHQHHHPPEQRSSIEDEEESHHQQHHLAQQQQQRPAERRAAGIGRGGPETRKPKPQISSIHHQTLHRRRKRQVGLSPPDGRLGQGVRWTSMCTVCFCSCIFLSRATPLGRSHHQASEPPHRIKFSH